LEHHHQSHWNEFSDFNVWNGWNRLGALQRFERSAWFDKLTMSGSVFPLILSGTKRVSTNGTT
jgi:hypothetical protein